MAELAVKIRSAKKTIRTEKILSKSDFRVWTENTAGRKQNWTVPELLS